MKTFTQTSTLPATVERVIAVHDHPRTLSLLTMPPLVLQILRDDRASLTEGEIEFRLWFGPIPVRWLARHASGPTPTSFMDDQVQGPLKHWTHEHIFEAVPDGTRLTDRITYEHRPGAGGLLTRLFFDGLPLRLLFIYRHWRTRLALGSGFLGLNLPVTGERK